MNTSEPTTVVKGEIDSIYRRSSGGGENLGSSFGIIGMIALIKVVAIAALVGTCYLFTFSPALGFLALLAVVGVVIYFIATSSERQAKRKAAYEASH